MPTWLSARWPVKAPVYHHREHAHLHRCCSLSSYSSSCLHAPQTYQFTLLQECHGVPGRHGTDVQQCTVHQRETPHYSVLWPSLNSNLLYAPNTLSVYTLPQTAQLEALFTIIRDKEMSRGDFFFYLDRIIRVLVEEGLNHLPVLPKTVVTPTVRACRNLARSWHGRRKRGWLSVSPQVQWPSARSSLSSLSACGQCSHSPSSHRSACTSSNPSSYL